MLSAPPKKQVRAYAALGVGAIVLLGIGAWILADTGSDSVARVGPPTRIALHWQQLVERGLQETSAAPSGGWPFEAIPPVPGGMPVALRQSAGDVLIDPAPLQLRFSRARAVRTADGEALWLVPGRGVLCMFRARRVAGVCGTTADAYEHGLLLELYRQANSEVGPTTFIAYGVVPDGVTSIVVQIGQRREALQIVRNTYSVKARTPINVISPSV